MIDPFKITDYNRSQIELEEFLIFCCLVAGKPAVRTSKKLDKFLSNHDPFNYLSLLIENAQLEAKLREYGFGQYKRLVKCFEGIIHSNLDLKKCSPEDLVAIHGIGLKTAHFFIVHSRRNSDYVILDTHNLKWLTDNGVKNVPKSTPGNIKKYQELSKEYLNLVQLSGKTMAEYDLEIWTKYAKK